MSNIADLGTVLANLGDSVGLMQSKLMLNIEKLSNDRSEALKFAEQDHARIVSEINIRYNLLLDMLTEQLKAVEAIQGL